MSLSKKEFKQFIRAFDFAALFNEMGWDREGKVQQVTAGDETFQIKTVADKRGFKVIVCEPGGDGQIPDQPTRQKIARKVEKLFHENLVIYFDRGRTRQIWQWRTKSGGKPQRLSETRWHIDQEPEALFQRASGIYFTIDEEDSITIVDVLAKVSSHFDQNNERVTKRFYAEFKRQHEKFADFVEGINDQIPLKENADKQWYVSLMLNRLMFCYFIQKKGFLDGDRNYLRNRLNECSSLFGKGQYFSFYKSFLVALFHKGLGAPDHTPELKELIGKIPYLNGGLFDEHVLERQFGEIDISDEAFENIFQFFDKWNWHLDTTENSDGRDINPDVIGYIFEKYINERSAMGAYYTKEDITDYISKNCILPFLFDETKRHYPAAFKQKGELWTLLRTSSDEYIYDAVKKGIKVPYPPEIEIGLDTEAPDLLERRKEWNKPAPEEAALPTEIWREVVDRRRRYHDVKSKIKACEITEINDFITYNLNIRKFALDCIENTQDPKFLEHFYKSIAGFMPAQGTNAKERHPLSILDPTCGSGAFLFAALNILEELYSACLERMESFIEDEDRTNAADKSNFKNQYAYFRSVLSEVVNEMLHPNRKYFVLKSIILNNLYGVDIMKEAVEIAKLRLFLRLVASVDAVQKQPNLGLEPLPDIDFNIRAGNTLVGFASNADLESTLRTTIEGLIAKPKIVESMDIVALAFSRFKDSQVTVDDYTLVKNAKESLRERMSALNGELNRLLHEHTTSEPYEAWVSSHKPFHWVAEFYEIVQKKGGFDCIIGNPPYVEKSKVSYSLKNYRTLKCGNLYAYVIERSYQIEHANGRFGMIVPISSVCTDRMVPLQEIFWTRASWNSTYAERPSKLFEGAEVQLLITLSAKQAPRHTFSTTYHKWPSDFRESLFQTISYYPVDDLLRSGTMPKIGTETEARIIQKIFEQSASIGTYLTKAGEVFVSYRNAGGRYFKVVLNFEPEFFINGIKERSSTYQRLYLNDEGVRDGICAVMNSNLFFWHWLIFSDTWHMIAREIYPFPVELSDKLIEALSPLNHQLMEDYVINSVARTEYRNRGKDVVQFSQFNARESKEIIDQIDKVLANHYGFDEGQTDFLLNYGIKYRLGNE